MHIKVSNGEYIELKDLFYAFKNHPDRFIFGNILISLLTLAAAIISGAIFAGLVFFVDAADTFSDIGFNFLAIFLLVILFTFIYLILFALISIFLLLRFSFVFLILCDDREIKLIDAFKKSNALMRGNYLSLIYIILSFIPLNIAGLLSFGLGFLWVVPYYEQTLTEFYMDVKASNEPQVTYENDYPNDENVKTKISLEKNEDITPPIKTCKI